MIRFSPIEYHIEDRAHTRLCDGRPASDADISSEDWSALREARRDATLCPDCQDKVNPRDVRPELYGYGRMSTAHLYSVPVLAAFDAIRNCSHCRRNTDDDCKAWREARESVSVLTQEARRLAKGVDELRDATGGCAANIYQFSCGSVAYFAPDAPDFQEAGELKGDDIAAVLQVLDAMEASIQSRVEQLKGPIFKRRDTASRRCLLDPITHGRRRRLLWSGRCKC